MSDEVTRRVVVIKDIPSNIIEEAILILKGEPSSKVNIRSKNKASKKQSVGDDYIFGEAQFIINSYLEENKLTALANKSNGLISKVHSRRPLTNIIINVALIGSIAVLIFLICRMLC